MCLAFLSSYTLDQGWCFDLRWAGAVPPVRHSLDRCWEILPPIVAQKALLVRAQAFSCTFPASRADDGFGKKYKLIAGRFGRLCTWPRDILAVPSKTLMSSDSNDISAFCELLILSYIDLDYRILECCLFSSTHRFSQPT